MLKLFFNRSSFFVYFFNIAALVEMLLLIFLSLKRAWPLGWGFYGLSATWLLLNALNQYPWYSQSKAKLGIRRHFQTMIVPAAYLWFLGFSLKLLGLPEFWLILIALLFLPIIYVSIMLLVFHQKDSSSLKPNYFSGNFYLKEKD